MKKKIHRTMIGGQAVIEGVMMRGVDKMALAVRKPDGTINLDVWQLKSMLDKHSPMRIPIIRGVINFVQMLILGYKTIMRSAEIAGLDDDDDSDEKNDGVEAAEKENPQKESEENAPEKQNSNKGEKAAMDIASAFSVVIGFAFAIVLFVILPTFVVGKTDPFIHWGVFKTLAEGVIKILIFIAYLALIANIKDIQRVYQYHGAEHKTIYCYEHGDELTPENARKYTRFHPRCGTSFLLIVLIISIIVFSFVTWKTLWMRVILKLLLLPVVVGISYEIIKFAGRHDTSVMRFLLAPGLWLQRLTTCEPDDSQLEVAIAAIKAVLTGNPDDDRW